MKWRVTAGIFFVLAILAGALWVRSWSWSDVLAIRFSENAGIVFVQIDSTILVSVESKRAVAAGFPNGLSSVKNTEPASSIWGDSSFQFTKVGFIVSVAHWVLVLPFLLLGAGCLFVRRE